MTSVQAAAAPRHGVLRAEPAAGAAGDPPHSTSPAAPAAGSNDAAALPRPTCQSFRPRSTFKLAQNASTLSFAISLVGTMIVFEAGIADVSPPTTLAISLIAW